MKKSADATDSPPADKEALEEIESEGNTALVPAASRSMTVGKISGDVDPSDFRPPRLQIAYGVGKLAADFSQGDLVLDAEHMLVSKGESLYVIVVSARKFWKEYLEFNEANRPRIFETKQEVHEVGGTTDWVGGKGPTFSPAMDLTLLIQKPEGVTCGLFGLMIGENESAPAFWSVDKQAYKKIGPPLLTMSQLSLAEKGLHSAIMELQTSVTVLGSKTNTLPNIKVHEHLSDEDIAEVASLCGNLGAAV